MSRITDDLYVDGTLVVTGAISAPAAGITNAMISTTAEIARSKLAQDVLKKYPTLLTDWRVWDAFATNLPATSATDDLGLYGGTFATNSPEIKTSDLKAAGSTTRYARALIVLPAEYEDGQTVQIRVHGGMETTVADVAATVDIEAYEIDREGGISADLCTTSAQSINSLTEASKDFTITATGLVAGDVLDVRLTVLVNDAATATAVTAAIGEVALLCDVRG